MPYLKQETVAPPFARRLPFPAMDACCAADQRAPATLSTPPLRRTRLADLDEHVHCSIIGTCLSTGELRKRVPRHDPAIERASATDLAIHHAAVKLSTRDEAAAKELGKALDTRHALAIRQFKSATTEAALAGLWRDAMAGGDVPGAYWALMTHPLSTFALRTEAFGDVHMLSHLVGASNRADIRRLASLEAECVGLRAQNAAQGARLAALTAQHAGALALAEEKTGDARRLDARLAQLLTDDATRELAAARACLATLREQAALLEARCAAADARALAGEAAAAQAQAVLAEGRAEIAAAQSEIHVLEQALTHAWREDDAQAALPPLAGLAIAYVGGRRQATLILARLVADAGGELLVHDGGIEDRKGLLDATLARAQLVVFPVDCISHNAMQVTKGLAARKGIPCHALRKASVASFVELIQRVVGRRPCELDAAPGSA